MKHLKSSFEFKVFLQDSHSRFLGKLKCDYFLLAESKIVSSHLTICSFEFPQGSQNIVYLGIEDKEKLANGGFYRDAKIEEKENQKLDSMSDVGEELWKLSEKLSGLK